MKQGMVDRAQERAAAQAYVDALNASGARAPRPLAPGGLDGVPVDDLEDTLFDHDGHFYNPETGAIEEVRLAAIPEPPLASGRGSSGADIRDGLEQFWESRSRNWEHQPKREILAPPPELDLQNIPGQAQFEASKARQQLELRMAQLTALTPETKNAPTGVYDSVRESTLNRDGNPAAPSNWDTRPGEDTRLQDKYGLPVSDSGWIGVMGQGSGTGFWYGRDRYAAELLERMGHGSAADVAGETISRHPNAYGADLSDFVGIPVPHQLAMVGAVTTINDGAGEQASASAAASGVAGATDYSDLGLGLDTQLARDAVHTGDLGYDQVADGRGGTVDVSAFVGANDPRAGTVHQTLGYDQHVDGRGSTADLGAYVGAADPSRSAVHQTLGYDQHATGRAQAADLSAYVGVADQSRSAVHQSLGYDQHAAGRVQVADLGSYVGDAGAELRSAVHQSLGYDQHADGRAGVADLSAYVGATDQSRSAVHQSLGYDQHADPRAGVADLSGYVGDAGAELRSAAYQSLGYDQHADPRAQVADLGSFVGAVDQTRSAVHQSLGYDQHATGRSQVADLSAYVGDAGSQSRSGFGVRPFNPAREVPSASGAGRTEVDHQQQALDWGWAPAIPPRPESDKHPHIGQNPRAVVPDVFDDPSQVRAGTTAGRPDNYAQEYAGRFDNPEIPAEFGAGVGLVPTAEAPRAQSVRDQLGANPRVLTDPDLNGDRANWPCQSALDQAARVEAGADKDAAVSNGWFNQKADWIAAAAGVYDLDRQVAAARPTMAEMKPEQDASRELWSRTHALGNEFDAHVARGFGIRGRAAAEIDGLSDISGYNTDDTGFASDGSSVA